MKKYNDLELESLLDEVESDHVERKESWKGDAPEKSRQAICAFANDLGNHDLSGVLIVGAKDNGTPSGFLIDDRLLLTLADLKSDGQILPLPTITIEKRILKGAHVTPDGQVVSRSRTPIQVVHGNARSLRKLVILR